MSYKIALILNGDRSLSSFPSACNAGRLLSKNGYEVTFFLPIDMKIDCVVECAEFVRFRRTRPAFMGIFKVLVTHARRYDLLIAFDSAELISSGLIGVIYKIPFVFFSLEIIGSDQIKTIKGRIIKYIEIFFSKKAAFIIVQDEVRKKLIKNTYEIYDNRIFCLPNSYIGIIKKTTNYLRDKFNIPNNKVIVLYAGGIESWAIDRSLIDAVCEWGDEYVLVLHGWSRCGYLHELKPLIDKVNYSKERIYLSLDMLNEEEYGACVSSANIGLAWYKKDLSENVAKIGLSSGKCASFLRCGLPVIVPSYLEGIGELVSKYQFGISADNEFKIKDAVALIMKNYQTYRDNAFNFCLNFLDYEKGFNDVLPEIHVLTRRKRR
ncbi:MAG: hypothetical protein A2103_01160 [Gammaproteobacteria bacterium GWF2_41_13]|nr:MAG: hypothetical protein A2103_01160 [Gammaproteobacteria bacterium GWF2_41_13]